MFLVSIDKSEVPTPYGAVLLFYNFVVVSNLTIFESGVVSLRCEWSSWTIRLSAAPVVAPYLEPTTAAMQMLFDRVSSLR
jgi:hypothetical protein